ncbi:DUF5590 domain-containing protein [Bacillus marinisedimentorum]|uniref:cell wall elongation regulator TseB-like domain-containing protein n=1 Tax=Bacillus marinisedimentorum TaxID=1821260 RepID=UPI00087219C6|nr:DUF5590 domain-containing protein [Bacillus marinisedimentorum]
MKKWILAIMIAVLAIAAVSLVNLYRTTLDPEKERADEASSVALENTEMESVGKVEHFHGTSAYHVVSGTDGSGQRMFAWIPDNHDGEPIVRYEKEGISKGQVIDFFNKEVNPRKIIDVRLGIEENVPVWEVSYIDRKDRISYYYLAFKDGTFIKRYRL